eukprot:5995201-Alexandrium_andersonii.AAC.1
MRPTTPHVGSCHTLRVSCAPQNHYPATDTPPRRPASFCAARKLRTPRQRASLATPLKRASAAARPASSKYSPRSR